MTLEQKLKIYNISFFINTFLFLGSVITALVVVYGNLLINADFAIIFLLPATLFGILASVSFLFAYITKHTLNDLLRANSFNLHRRNFFYNTELFYKDIIKHRRYLSRVPGYLIVYSPLNRSTYASTENVEMVRDYLGLVSDFIVDYIGHTKKYKEGLEAFYSYEDGQFYIYIARDREEIDQVVIDLDAAAYKVASDNNYRLFINPTIGVCPRNEGDEVHIYEMVTNVNRARKTAEENFETTVYYEPTSVNKKHEFTSEDFIQAFTQNEFVVYYQPKYHLATHTFTSLEALIRWDNPKYGLLSPSKFINSMEAFGFIHALDMYVFEAVCRDMYESKQRGQKVLPCSINFSLYEFYAPGFVNDIISTIEKLKINPALIELEVTESTTSANNFLAISILKKLKDFGIRILMDDFGKGYSNLMNVKKMPIDVVKIDKSFIDDIVIDSRSREVVKFLINFCRANNIEVIAEGVDDDKQVDILRMFKCDTIQGFYYSKPIPKIELRKFLANNKFEKKEGGK